MVSVFVRQMLVQLETPDAIRGRVSAVNSMFIGASNELGEFESGVTAKWFGTVRAVVLGGVAHARRGRQLHENIPRAAQARPLPRAAALAVHGSAISAEGEHGPSPRSRPVRFIQ